jgi:hypothetical protein
MLRQATDPVPLSDAVAELLSESDRRDLELQARIAWAAAEHERGRELGIEEGRRQALAEESAQRREAAGLVQAATSGPTQAELQRRRWMLRGEERTRETFADPHPDDYKDGPVKSW